MKKYWLSFIIINISIYSCLSTIENREATARDVKLAKKTSQDVSPELNIKIDEWMKLLYSEDPAIRTSAIISLLGLNIPTVDDSLIDILKNSENDDVRISLIKAFGFAGDDNRSLDCMIDLLTSENEAMRIASADALGNIGTKKAIKGMIDVLLNTRKPIESRILVDRCLGKDALTRGSGAVNQFTGI